MSRSVTQAEALIIISTQSQIGAPFFRPPLETSRKSPKIPEPPPPTPPNNY